MGQKKSKAHHIAWGTGSDSITGQHIDTHPAAKTATTNVTLIAARMMPNSIDGDTQWL